MREAFAKAGVYPTIEPGDVWKAKDSAILLLGAFTRHFHEERYCVVLSNRQMCSDNDWPLILIAPLSSSIHPVARPDLIVGKTDKNGLTTRSRLILSQVQPLDKSSLQEKVGFVAAEQWEQIMRHVFWHIKR